MLCCIVNILPLLMTQISVSKKKHSKIVGYSGHERGVAISLAAYSLGARIIERHITLDRNMEGPDHAASLEPDELRQLLKGLFEIKAGFGFSGPRVISQGEMINRENLAKSLVASRKINLGELITRSDVSVVSPGRGLSPLRMTELIGKASKRTIQMGQFFEESDVCDSVDILRKDYNIVGNWGIPSDIMILYFSGLKCQNVGISSFIQRPRTRYFGSHLSKVRCRTYCPCSGTFF